MLKSMHFVFRGKRNTGVRLRRPQLYRLCCVLNLDGGVLMCAKTVLMNFLMQIVEGSLTQCKYGRVMHVLGMSFLEAV